MLILVLDITSPSGNYHKTLPISEQAASDPARRGNLIREAVAQYPNGKAAGWKVVDGDRIVAQSAMKTAISQSVPGVADSLHDRLTQGDADYVSALTGAPLQTVERDYHDDNEREAAPDPFDIPKADAVADELTEEDEAKYDEAVNEYKALEDSEPDEADFEDPDEYADEHATWQGKFDDADEPEEKDFAALREEAKEEALSEAADTESQCEGG